MKLRKGKAATRGTNHATMTSRPVPPVCPAPGSGRGRSGDETRGTQGLSQHPLPSCPRWRGAQHPGGARSGGESLVAGSVAVRCLYQAGCLQPTRRVSLLTPAAGSERRQPELRAIAGCEGTAGSQLRHETRPLALPRDFFH